MNFYFFQEEQKPLLGADTVGRKVACNLDVHVYREHWSVWMDSNHRPRAYQARALAT